MHNNATTTMSEVRWELINALDDELLNGGVILSEWCSHIVRETDLAFVGGAHLAVILTAVAGVETYLRSEYAVTGKERLVELISQSAIPRQLKKDLHRLRKYRNEWVHVDEPWNDEVLLDPEKAERELEGMALLAVHALRHTIYENQLV